MPRPSAWRAGTDCVRPEPTDEIEDGLLAPEIHRLGLNVYASRRE
jgi:hypothetical protein